MTTVQSTDPPMIIDCHCHIASHRILPAAFLEGWARTVKSNLPFKLRGAQEKRIDSLLYELNQDPECAMLLEQMDRAGIAKAVLLVIDFGLAYKDVGTSIEAIHLEHKKLLDRSDRFIGFSNVDPRRGKEGLDLFERAIREWGFQGLKLYAPCGYSPNDRILFPYYEICQQFRLPVLTHIGPTTATLSFQNTQPIDVDDAALNFPDVKFILGHAAIMHYRSAGLMAQYRPNIYLDLSGFQSAVSRDEFKSILSWHLSRGLAKKLLFGTDWPIYRFWGSQSDWVEQLKALQRDGSVTEQDLVGILGENIRTILPLAARRHVAHGT